MKDVSIKYDEKILNCTHKIEGDRLYIDITSVKPGKTTILVKGTQNGEKPTNNTYDIYVHKSRIITKHNYLGYCNGGISFVISYFIIMGFIVVYLIMEYKKRIQKRLYSYRNVRFLGLAIFIAISYMFNVFLFVYDLAHGVHQQSIYSSLLELKNNIHIFLALIFPIALIVTILVTISNIKLLLKEGKSWKNMLAMALGGFFCISTLIIVLLQPISINDNDFKIIVREYINDIVTMFIIYLECLLIGTCALGFKSARHIPKFDKDAIIILGCKIRTDGTLTNLLKSRVDRAIEFAKMQKEATGKDIIFVPSGGKGNDEVISEAQAMKNYLIQQGISEEDILVEDKSKNTYENIEFSSKIINEKIENVKMAFSTTNYHVFRAGTIALKQNIDIEGIGSKTKAYYWVNAFIREFVATLILEKINHIKILIGFMLIILAFITMVHL